MNETKDETTSTRCLAPTFTRGETPSNGTEHKRARHTRLCSLVLAALLVALVRSATQSGAIDTTDTTWTISGEGAATPNLQILEPLLWLFVGSTDYLRLSRLRTLVVCDRLRLSGRVL